MGLFKKLAGRPSTSNENDEPSSSQDAAAATTSRHTARKPSSISLVPLSEVTEASLKVWRQLPNSIRHDPSMVSFQQEHERWKGKKTVISVDIS